MATSKRDYYEVLGLARDADEKAIKNAFRSLALKYHPDRNKEPGAEERFKEIAEAYAVLSDPNKRREYDAGGFAGVAGFSPQDLFGGIDFDEIFGGLNFGFGPGSLFENLLRRRTGPPRGANIEVELVVPLARIATGGEETIRVERPQTCPSCKGTRAKPGTKPRPCEACKGTGSRSRSGREGKGNILIQQITICPVCGGEGVIIEQYCDKCGGRGQVDTLDALSVKIPPGVEDGMALRLTGKGMPAREARGRPGDLYVVVRSERDARFERRGADLWRDEPLDVADAVLGTTLEVPTLEKTAEVTVPAGTQPDSVLRLRGKGLPEFGGKSRGDIYVRLRVRVPERPSASERELYERLRALRRKPPRL